MIIIKKGKQLTLQLLAWKLLYAGGNGRSLTGSLPSPGVGQ